MDSELEGGGGVDELDSVEAGAIACLGLHAALFLCSRKRAAHIAAGIKSIVFKWMTLKTNVFK